VLVTSRIARHAAAIATLITLGSSVGQGQATQSASDTRGALAAVERMFEGMRTADSAMVRSVFAAGARFAMVDTRSTPAAIRFDTVGGWIAAIATSNRAWDEQIYDVQVLVDGNIAQVWAPYTFYLDKQVRHCGVNAIDLLRDGEGWKVTQVADTRRRDNCPDPLKR
jgi:hypothetical protein